ncbi:murein L,D-transpeptidase catalytic domain family protein [Algoriphagus marinus]|uniref:murein L,D-transpeptidase catalytic domain family protein n=1 Tax=Algoriphagus marinus TaxID=1925762 RepID=UPI00094B89DA|nr:murein L,D-transpeptidase catalytic domain family protein [Algoriphagus marinus]
MNLSNFLFPILFFFNSHFTPIPTDSNSPSLEEKSDTASEIYFSLNHPDGDLPSKEIFELAYAGWEKMDDKLNSPILTIVDFSLPSTERRLWIVDLTTKTVSLNTVVAHGRNSGELIASKFSNKPESYQSSLGFYKTGETYQGKHGYSLRLDGLEKGINDQARNRAIVIHGADYANESFAKINGRLGRSLGCPALPAELSSKAIDLIKDGSLLFIYGNDANYLSKSILSQP